MKDSIREALLRRQPAVVRNAVREGRSWARSRGEEARMLPSFLILGGQRCGTTTLYRYLSKHPDVHPGLVKEIQFFTLNYGRGVDWYRAQFPAESAGGQSFDASPYYLYHPAAPERAAGLLPDAKLIALLRNPVDRAFSHYQHNVGNGVENLSFEEALEAEEGRLAGEEERLAGDPSYSSPAHRRYSYVARGRYEAQLRRWLGRYDSAGFKVVISEEFFADPAGTFAEVLEFLGLPPLELPGNGVYSRRGRDGPALSRETRSRLQELFLDSNQRLEGLLGRSLPWV